MSVSCIVMAAGMSKRMGSNKLMLELNNKKLFEYILDTINKVEFDEIIVVTRFKEIEIYSKKLGYTVVENKEYQSGQSSSIRLGIETAKKNNDYMFFVADQPNISKKTIEVILEKNKANKKSIILPFYNKIKGNPVIFPNKLRGNLLGLLGDTGGSKVIKANENIIEKIYFDNSENVDIDTIEDYEKIRSEYER